ncbi:MAG TPA: rhomboid family intramembrane serine protease [Chthonomonadaceae bacterium]|nr:rhomboid family intramembrane serine protease [Chthonomonadaceae bacterium]
MPDSWEFNQRPSSGSANTQVPVLTYLLCSVCVLLTLANLTSGDTPSSFWYQLGHFADPDTDAIWSGRYYLLFTSMFLHVNYIHLIFNMLWMAQLGRAMETTLNPAIYFLFIVVAAILSSGAELCFMGGTGIGASGVVYAMFGLMWAGRARFPEWRAYATRQNLNLFLGWGVLCIITTITHIMNVGNFAHAGGLVFGLAIGWLFFAPRRQPLWAIPLALLVGITVLSVTWLPWTSAWNFWKGSREFTHERYQSAITYYQRCVKFDPDNSAAWHNIGAAWHNIYIQLDESRDQDAIQRAQAQEAIAEERAKQIEQRESKQEQDAAKSEEGTSILKGLGPSPEAPGSSGDTTQ